MPDWLPDVTLTDLRLGRRRFNIRFWRDGKSTIFKVLKGSPEAVERSSTCGCWARLNETPGKSRGAA
ncbi:hypothetical protein V4R08_18055 (plasmid) [Nitrobacter sp. NHB1]|uniref:hypothetical protein n=1 Tax=Nitrobacter sp. NHB1 TaxID=3119830 RepID=UPI002FFE22F6